MSAFRTLLPIFLVAATGCSGLEVPAVVDPNAAVVNYSVEDWQRDFAKYERAMDAYRTTSEEKDLLAASLHRNRMVNRVRADIRSYHAEFEAALTKGIAQWNVWGDFMQLGLALASTVTKGRETKTILSAVIAATAGAKLSVDKNFFREKASEVLVSSMRTARLEKDTVIVGKIASMKADDYPLEEALVDLVDLYYAGTLTEAFQRLAKEASVAEERADEEASELNKNRAYLLAASDEQIDKRREVSGAILKLKGKQLDAMVAAMSIQVDSGATSDEKRRSLIKELKAQTQGKAAEDPVWATWEQKLAEAQKEEGGS